MILGSDGLPLLTEDVAHGTYAERFQRVIGSRLEPQYVASCFALSDQGYFDALADLLGELRRVDGHAHSVLSKRESTVSSGDWEIEPAPGGGDTDDEVARYCTDAFDDLETGSDLLSFTGLVHELQGGIYYGRAVVETTWTQDGRWWRPQRFRAVHPRRLAMPVDNELRIWDSWGGALGAPGSSHGAAESPFTVFPGVALSAFPRGKFIRHEPRTSPGETPMRQGIGQQIAWWSTFARFGMRQFLALVEWAGRGLRVGKYDAGDSKGVSVSRPENKTALQQTLQHMSSAIASVISNKEEIEIIQPDGRAALHPQLIELCQSMISKVALGNTLSTEVGSKGGSRAVASEQREGELAIGRADAKRVAETLKRDLLLPMVRMNFGDTARPPRLRAHIEPPPDREAQSRVIDAAVRSGVHITQRQARNALGFEDPRGSEDGDQIVEPARKSEKAPPGQEQ